MDPMLSPVALHTTGTLRKHLFSVERNEKDVLGWLEISSAIPALSMDPKRFFCFTGNCSIFRPASRLRTDVIKRVFAEI